MTPYFAYGSNLCLNRFRSPKRVPSAELVGIATLERHKLVFQKRSRDGSGKATLIPQTDSRVIGALYVYNHDKHHEQLKRVGSGYDETPITVSATGGDIKAITFICNPSELDATLRPFDWYLDLVRLGGRKLGISEVYLKQFESVLTLKDLDAAREKAERSFLG
jgi:hypothetical protein